MEKLSIIVIITVFFVLASVLSTATNTRDDRDEFCHGSGCSNHHNDDYYQYIVIITFDAPDSLEKGEESTVEITIENQCNSDKENYYTFDWVDLTLTSVNGKIDITDSEQRINDMGRGESNRRTVSWTILGDEVGDDSLSVDIHAKNSHKDSDRYASEDHDIEVKTAPPDVSVNSIEIVPDSPHEGETITITSELENTGGTATWDVTLEIDDVQVDSQNIEVDEGETVEVSTDWNTSGSPGDRTITVTASGVGEEKDMDDNSLELEFHVRTRPDLTVTTLSFDPENPVDGQMIDIHAVIENLGETGASFNVICILNDGNITIGEAELELEAGSSNNISFPWIPEGMEGEHSISVHVDRNNTVNETDESNNKMEKNITVQPPSDLPDPSVHPGDIGIPESVPEGEGIVIPVTVRNLGNANITCNLLVTINGEETYDVGNVSVSLNVTEYRVLSFPWNTTGATGNWDITVELVNLSGEEFNSENNLAVKEFTVNTRPDLFIENVTWFPLSPAPGSELQIDVTVANTGGTDAAGTLEMRFGGNLEEIPVTVSAGVVEVAKVNFTFATGATIIQAELTNVTPWEWNTENNAIEVDISEFLVQDLHVESFEILPAFPALGDDIELVINVSNNGSVEGNGNLLIYHDGEMVKNYPVTLLPRENIAFHHTIEIYTLPATFFVMLHLPEEDIGGIEEYTKNLSWTSMLAETSLTLLSISPSDPVIGEDISVTVLVYNSMFLSVNATISVFLDGELQYGKTIGNGSGAEFLTFVLSNVPIGAHVVEARITHVDENTFIRTSNLSRNIYVEAFKDQADDDGIFTHFQWLTFGSILVLFMVSYALIKSYRVVKKPASKKENLTTQKEKVSGDGENNPPGEKGEVVKE